MNEVCIFYDFVKRFRERVTLDKYPNLILNLLKSKTHMILRQTDNQRLAVVFSKDLCRKLGFLQNGLTLDFTRFDMMDDFTDKWSMDVYHLDAVNDYNNESMVHEITLEPKLFQNTTELCTFLTNKIGRNDISIVAKENIAHLTMNSKALSIQFSKDVQDILGLDKPIYHGMCRVKGSDVISLTRRINYFYIYSNISEFVRVGDTKVPLLCHFPFNPKQCNLITERVFKRPTYMKVTGNRLSQIDIGIYDDAGKLIPFQQDAVTSIRLHFRRI